MSKKTIRRAAQSTAAGSSTTWMTYAGIGLVLLVLVVGGFFVFASGTPPSDDDFSNDDLLGSAHVTGSETAPVTIVEFSDFQCPACAAAFPAIKQVLSQYEGRVRLAYRHFPLTNIHPFAVVSAEAAECAADQEKFWEMHDVLFQNQSSWSTSGRDGIRILAQQIGLDMTAYDACMAARTHLSTVQSDLDAGIRFGVTATPTFFVNGQKLSGFSQSRLVALIEAELASAS